MTAKITEHCPIKLRQTIIIFMKKYSRLKTDLKSTVLTDEGQQDPQKLECTREVLKYMQRDELFQSVLAKVLLKLALKPCDLIPLARSEVQQSSLKQIKQLCKQDVDYYLDNKCGKLEARRLGLVKEVAREYTQMEKALILEVQYAPIRSDIEVTKRRNNTRYREVDDEERLIKNEERRIRAMRRLKLQDVSQRDIRNQVQRNLRRKLSAADSRREQYKVHVESMRSSQVMSPNQHRRKMKTLHEQELKSSEETNKQIIFKLTRATKSREERRRQNQSKLQKQNEGLFQKVKLWKEASIEVQQKHLKILKQQISKDLEQHAKNKSLILKHNLNSIKTRRSLEDRRIQNIKVCIRKKQDKEKKISLKIMKEKEQHVEQNKQEIRHKIQQAIRQKQQMRNSKIGDVYRRKSMADLENQKRRNILLRYRLETEAMVSQRKKSMDVEKRRGHIIEQIKIQISALNVKRHHRMEEFKVEQTKEELNLIDKKNKELEDKKNTMYENRQKLKIILQKRKQNLDFYFDSRVKDFMSLGVSKNNELYLTDTHIGRSVDLEEIQKTKEFRNLMD